MDRFHIMYWFGPPPSETTLARYKEIRDAGFTMISPPGTGIMNSSGVREDTVSDDTNHKLLDIGKNLGMKVLLADPRIYTAIGTKGPIDDDLKKVDDEFGSHPALEAYFVTDEPSAKIFPRLGQITAELKKLDSKHLSFINLFPTYASPQQLGSVDYRHHLEEFIGAVKPSVVSYDHYHWLLDSKAPAPPSELNERDRAIWENAWDRKGSGLDRPGYLENLQITWEVCQKHRLPMVVVTLLLPHGPYRDPGPAELRWDCYQALAYGVKALCWFTYWTPGMDEWNFHNACITEDGKRTHNYAEIADVNKEILPIGRLLYQKRSLGVMHVGPETEPVEPFKPNAVIREAEGGRFTLGMFTNGVILIANKDYTKSAVCRLKLGEKIKSTIYDRRLARYIPLPPRDGWLELDLAPGGGELIKLA